jgi:hypothetical protein
MRNIMKDDKGKKDEVRLSTPWGRGNVNIQQGAFIDPESTRHFIEQRSKVHSTYILEQEKTKRLSLILAVVLLISALVIMIFAPDGKEQIS